MKKILIYFIVLIMITAYFSGVALSENKYEHLPDNMTFSEILGFKNISEIESGVIADYDGKCSDIEPEDLKNYLNVFKNFSSFDRVTAPKESYVYDDYYIKLQSKDKTASCIIYPHIGIIVGRFGQPCESHGTLKNNYVWYLPYIGNARNALYTANTKLFQKYLNEESDTFVNNLREVTPLDAETLPDNNILVTEGASNWAKPEIEKAAACNLLLYELTDNYTEPITRQEFCDLIYRLIMTEFTPNSDSRMSTMNVMENIVGERNLQLKMKSVNYSDTDSEIIKFLTAAEIIYGIGNESFAPESNITREQAAAILYRTAVFLKNKTVLTPDYDNLFPESKISDWATKPVAIISAMGIMKGVSQKDFAPASPFTVEQSIATMVRLYECY